MDQNIMPIFSRVNDIGIRTFVAYLRCIDFNSVNSVIPGEQRSWTCRSANDCVPLRSRLDWWAWNVRYSICLSHLFGRTGTHVTLPKISIIISRPGGLRDSSSIVAEGHSCSSWDHDRELEIESKCDRQRNNRKKFNTEWQFHRSESTRRVEILHGGLLLGPHCSSTHLAVLVLLLISFRTNERNFLCKKNEIELSRFIHLWTSKPVSSREEKDQRTEQKNWAESQRGIIHIHKCHGRFRRKDEENDDQTDPQKSDDIHREWPTTKMKRTTRKDIPKEHFTQQGQTVGDIQTNGAQTSDSAVSRRIDQIGKTKKESNGTRKPNSIQWTRTARMNAMPHITPRLEKRQSRDSFRRGEVIKYQSLISTESIDHPRIRGHGEQST